MSLAWGNQKNGRIGSNLLVPARNYRPLRSQQKYLTGQSGLLRADVAAQWSLMVDACFLATGKTLYLSEGYRSFDSQSTRYYDPARKTLAAFPGNSLHGWALSTDFLNDDPDVVNWVHGNCHLYGFEPTIDTENWHLDCIKTPTVTPSSVAAVVIPDNLEDSLSAAEATLIVQQVGAVLNDRTNDLAALIKKQDASRRVLIRRKGAAEVFLSNDLQTIRWIESEKDLEDVKWLLIQGGSDATVREVENVAAFGAFEGNRPKGY
jgi:hypothetical protein